MRRLTVTTGLLAAGAGDDSATLSKVVGEPIVVSLWHFSGREVVTLVSSV